MEVTEKVKELIEPIAQKRKYYIVDITYRREGEGLVLRILVDKVGGITMDEYAKLNNELSELLDKKNIIAEQYILEVSSPGLDRRLKTDRDFVWAVGKKIRVTTYAPLNGRSAFSGVLVGLRDGTLVLDEDGISTEIPTEKIASAKLELDRTNRNSEIC